MFKKLFLMGAIVPGCLFSAFEKAETGALPLALSNSMVSFTNTIYALYYNPSNLSLDDSFSLSLDYRNFYDLPELNQISITSGFKIEQFPVGFGVKRYGNNLYQEIGITAGCAYAISDEIRIGTAVSYYALNIANYGQASALGINLGLDYDLMEKISIGAFAGNVNQPEIGSIAEKLPQTFALGMGYLPYDKLQMTFEFFRDTHFEQNYRAGLAYDVMQILQIRIGLDDKKNQYSFGFGLKYSDMGFDYALIQNEILGTSHAISLQVII